MSIVKRFRENLSKWRIKSKLCNRAVGSKEGYFVSIEGHEAKYNLDGFGPLEYRTLSSKSSKTFIGSWVNEGQDLYGSK
jgi:hypothetical protein